MASDYGRNFGFRRSDESLAIREGRFKTPVGTAGAVLLGSAVEIDAAAPGFVKKCAANPAAITSLRGLLVQEESHIDSVFNGSLNGHDSIDLGISKPDQPTTFWSGKGLKVWFRNTPAYDRGTRHRDAVTMLSGTLAIGAGLGWDGSKWIVTDGTTTPIWMRITHFAVGYAEAVLDF